MIIDETEVLAHEARVQQYRAAIIACNAYLARGTQTTAQNTAQIRLLTQMIIVLGKHSLNEG